MVNKDAFRRPIAPQTSTPHHRRKPDHVFPDRILPVSDPVCMKKEKANHMNMKSRTLNCVAAALVAALSLVSPAAADITSYTVDLREATCWSGAHTIYANDSGMSGRYSLRVYDSDGETRLTKGTHYSASINNSTHNLSFTPDRSAFPDGFCGVLVLRGRSVAPTPPTQAIFRPAAPGLGSASLTRTATASGHTRASYTPAMQTRRLPCCTHRPARAM